MDLDKAINYFNEYTSHFKVADNKVTIKLNIQWVLFRLQNILQKI